MLDHHMEAAVGKFVKAVKETDTYKGYCYQLEKIKKSPELFERVNEFRHRNYEIQNTSQVNELFDKMDAFEEEYEKFRENPIVDDFLTAELAFCRLMQEIDMFITEELNFE
ncbi:MAG: YlbF family regulator [Lachnospiraceae bacterium]|nr:YlbF family regulator [Lachnospiraceae bacterium]